MKLMEKPNFYNKVLFSLDSKNTLKKKENVYCSKKIFEI